ncbi:hypothetical protein ESZ36_00820 [Colwellia demingiae]|uniref:Uncharacterized protein n=1 Tax=Colwellia demingiae TaxID=89401 RepID=A0A5C6QRB3_9GAMM|nr:hypothetical protein [Colwellia demingiae]TWX71806.1 hypothetical protein ESZ36_00820 [Colwellia demingiae]
MATTQKGERPLRSPFQSPERPLSRTLNNKLAQTTIPANLSSMNNGSSRRPVSGRGLPLLVGHFIAEIGLECLASLG